MTEPIRLTPADRRESQALVDAYAESWQRIDDAQLALVDDPLNARKRARLNEMQDMVSREIRKLDATAQQYVAREYPKVYGNAARRAAEAVDPSAAAFVQPQVEAAQALADGLERQLLEATRNVDESTKALIRKIGRDAGLKTAIDGKTAKQAAIEMRRILNQSGIYAVTYANGAKVGLKAYTEMAVRTSTALALNQGMLQGSADAGCQFWEVFDGQSCGWTRHQDPDRAHGKVVTREQALANPIAHPNCRRALGPRPDLGVDREKVRPPQKPADQAEIAARADGNTPSVSREPPGAPEDRVAAANTRASSAAERAATAQARAAASPRAQAANLPDPTPADADKVYPRFLVELAKIDKRIKAKIPPGYLGESKRRMRERLAAGDFDPDRASEHDLLVWMQNQSAIEGFGDNLAVANQVLSEHNRARVIRYLVDGGKVPDTVDLKAGTKASDVTPIYPRTDADEFWEPDLSETNRRDLSLAAQKAIDDFEREVWTETTQLTPAQSATLRSYSRGQDQAINGALRKGGGDGPRINAIRAAMRPVPRSIRVRRGVNMDAFGYRFPTTGPGGGEVRDRAQMVEFLRRQVGQVQEDRGFVSTSVNPDGAFAADVELIIDVPEGFRGSWLEPFSSTPGEAEFLLDRGTRLEFYEIIDRTDDPKNQFVAQLRARVVYQDDMHDYDPEKARQAAAARRSEPAVRETPPPSAPPKSPQVPTKLPPPPAPESPVKAPVAKPAVVDPVGGLPFDVPKRPNGISKAELDKIGVDGSVYFKDGTVLKSNGLTIRDGEILSMGGGARAKWAKEVVRLHNEYNRKPGPDLPETPPPPPSQPVVASKTILEKYNGGAGVVSRQPLTGGVMAEQIEAVTFADGTKAVVKRSNLNQEAATEVAYSRVGQRLGVKVPDVYRLDDRTVLMNFVEDTRDRDEYGLADWWGDDIPEAAQRLADSESGRRLGLLDTVLQHQDRHQMNWLVGRDGEIAPIDNGMLYIEVNGAPLKSIFADRLGLFKLKGLGSDQVGEWLDNDYTAADWEFVREAIRAAESELRELPVGPITKYSGGTPPKDGFEAVMARIDAMAAKARGTNDRIVR